MNPRIVRVTAWLIALILVATPIVAVLNGWFADQRWPIRSLVIQGRFVRVGEDSVRAAIAPFIRDGFFAVDLHAVRAAIEAIPWVARAEVRKHWPDRIDVRIEERVPIAFWGDDRLLGHRGEVFSADLGRVPRDLPRLIGPEGRAGEVWRQHLILRERLASIGFAIRATRMDPRGAWSVVNADGAEIMLGREQTAQRLDRFIAVMRRLPEAERARVARADLRYANGFTVVWRSAVEPGSHMPTTSDPHLEEAHEPEA